MKITEEGCRAIAKAMNRITNAVYCEYKVMTCINGQSPRQTGTTYKPFITSPEGEHVESFYEDNYHEYIEANGEKLAEDLNKRFNGLMIDYNISTEIGVEDSLTVTLEGRGIAKIRLDVEFVQADIDAFIERALCDA